MAKSDLEKRISEAEADVGDEIWKADVDTDLKEFCVREGIPLIGSRQESKRGKGALNYIGLMIQGAYSDGFTTVGGLASLSKPELLKYGLGGHPKAAINGQLKTGHFG